MLILTRKPGQSVCIGEHESVTVLSVRGQIVRLGFTAPPGVLILREELHPLGVGPLEADHVSHASQHAPFTREPTDYGYESLNAGLRWRPVQGLTVDALEGAVLNRHYCDTNSYGAMVGPREVFTARVTYEIQVRP